ncbi:hypothetical protein [Actinophytocola sp. KF-1]
MKKFIAGLAVVLGMTAAGLVLTASGAAAEPASAQVVSAEQQCGNDHFPYNSVEI